MLRGKVTAVTDAGVFVQTADYTVGPCQAVSAPYTVGDMVLCVNVGDDTSPDLVVVGTVSATGSTGGGIADPGTVTDNAVVRWDGTSGSAVQNSGVTIDDNNNIIMPTASGTNAVFDIRAAESGRNAGITIRTGTTRRWAINKDATGESGSNVGSDLQISRYADNDSGLGAVIFLKRSTGLVRIANVGADAGLEFGSSGPRMMMGTGTPSGVSAPVGSTWRQTDANSTYGNLTGLLWNKVGTGTTLGTDWLVDFEGRWIDYTPSNSNITIGTTGNANTGTYTLSGKTCQGRAYLKLGTGGSFTGTANVGLPHAAATYSAPIIYAGSAYLEDAGIAAYYGWVSIASGATRFTVPYAGASSTINNVVGASTPFAWGAGDFLSAAFTYQIA